MIEHKQKQVTLTVTADTAPAPYRAAANARYALSRLEVFTTTEGRRLQSDARELLRLMREIKEALGNA